MPSSAEAAPSSDGSVQRGWTGADAGERDRGCGGRRRRNRWRVVRLLPAPQRAAAGCPDRETDARPGRKQPSGRCRPHSGRYPVGSAAGGVVPQVLPQPARGTWHRFRVHQAGLPASVLYRSRRRGCPRAHGHAECARLVGPLAGTRPSRCAEPDTGTGTDPGRHLLRGGRLPDAAPQRDGLRGSACHQRRAGTRADHVSRPGDQR